MAAERLYVRYSILERSLSIADLQAYAKHGRRSPQLDSYLRFLRLGQQQQLRSLLQERVQLEPVSMAQFLYSPLGERLLHRLAQVIRPTSDRIGFYGLRSALILAAADPDGLTLISILRHYPGPTLQVDLVKGLEMFASIQQVVVQTKQALTAVQAQSAAEIAKAPLQLPSELSALQDSGPWGWDKVSFKLTDSSPQRIELTGAPRHFAAEVYLPRLPQPASQPVVVISHGLGSNLQSYAYLAEHLASFGFVVAVLEHPGSSTDQLMVWLKGAGKQPTPPAEFIDRPLDIKFLLDELERRSQTDPMFRDRLNLQQVGLIGQSFGGYTVLALAGAKIDFTHLHQVCNAQSDLSLNLSLLFQCQSLELPHRDYDFADPRIKAVIAVNPIISGMFGQASLAQVKLPVMMVASSADTFAPPLSEQIQPFTWLTAPKRYLVMIDHATHFSTLGEATPGSAVLPIPPELIGPQPSLARQYLNALSTAFFQTCISRDRPTGPLLTPAAVSAIGQTALPLSLSRQFTAADLKMALQAQPPPPEKSSWRSPVYPRAVFVP
jgi:predicted dienelactone hydrolase